MGFAVALTLVLLGIFLLKKQHEKIIERTLKIVSLVFATIFVVRYMSGGEAIRSAFALNTTPLSPAMTAVVLILIWLVYTSNVLLTIFPFFKIKAVSNLVKYFSTAVSLLNFVLLYWHIIGICGAEAVTSFDFRALLMGLEAGISLAYSSYILFSEGFRMTKKETLLMFLTIPFMMIAAMPSYLPQALFGHGNPNLEVDGLSQTHRIFLYFGFIIPLCIYFVFRKKDYAVRHFTLLYISLAALLAYTAVFRFDSFLNPLHWPLHLCNTAMYIIPLCLIFKWEKLFYFTYFINVLGAFLAMLMPNMVANILATDTMHFWLNHYCAFFMPILIVALKIYPRPRLRQFIYSMVGFAIYFFLILIINAWFSNYGSVDYFFTNSDFIAEKLGKWAEDLRLVTWEFNIGSLNFVFYPVYQILFFLVYAVAALGMWFLYELMYTFEDQMIDMHERKRKIKLDELALKIDKGVVMSEIEKVDLKLEHFSKKYSSSKVFAVEDANLEVHGGEIFGFLGPNGAGKSTIIKSIVGIQTITEGKIEVCGYDVEKQSVECKKLIGFVPDHYALYEKLTGREYINYITDLYEVSKEDRDRRIEKYVTLFNLEKAFDNQMKTYSHGMKQKIAIISALVHDPKVWILDEPLTGLDPNSIFEVKECMKSHALEGNIVFFSSHIIDVVERICDRIAIIKGGKLQCVKTLEEIEKSGKTLEEFYLSVIGQEEAK